MIGKKQLVIATLLLSMMVVVMIVMVDIVILVSLPVSAIIRPLRSNNLSDLSAGYHSSGNTDKQTDEGDPVEIANYQTINMSFTTLTGEDGPSISLLQQQLIRCSLTMGMSRRTLDSRANAINTIATNLSIYLTAIRSIVPRQFSLVHSSNCWESPLPKLTKTQHEALDSLSTATGNTRELLTNQLHGKIMETAAHQDSAVRLQCLPAFFLAGFPKSGTTTLHRALSKHRLIALPYAKEPHWWTRMPLLYEDINYLQLATVKYLNYFSEDAHTVVGKYPQTLIYDGSQSTLWDSNFLNDNQDHCAMPVALAHILPRAKFLVMMREPVSRTYSHYLYSCTSKNEHPSDPNEFHREAMQAVELLSNCLNHSSLFECASDPSFSISDSGGCGSLGYRLIVSLYSLHLEKWLQFYHQEQFLFLRLEDLSRDPKRFMTRITRFFKIPDVKPTTTRWLKNYRENKQEEKVAMLPETQVLLSQFFRPFNERLVELTHDMRFLWADIP